ncbi:hypothetical protein E8E14_013641 [Neopestalotiopsis sp. 37M]|nr:hypothetical protein E8E14_013641 [Neopestalotiopsis sp. 37M]
MEDPEYKKGTDMVIMRQTFSGKESSTENVRPPTFQQYFTALRQRKSTPSQHREVKETLNARSEYIRDATGRTRLRINQYIIKEEVGRGSYGAVHRVIDQYGNEYAMKQFSKSRLRKRVPSNILKQHGGLRSGCGMQAPSSARREDMSNYDLAEEEDALFLIREEISVMKKLDHPSLVSLIEVLDDPGEDSLWIVLELCEKGMIMKVRLDKDTVPYSMERCRLWFRDLVLGVEYLHMHGILHRDIKPDNLLLTQDDCLKIVDFGSSELYEGSDFVKTAKSAGSPAFLPPELCVANPGNVSGRAADIWCMGVSLYCLKYGRLPFQGHNVSEIFRSIRTEEVSVLSFENPELADLIRAILQKDPGQRICMRELRNHPWVTRNGDHPLLSEKDNVAEIVEPLDGLEVHHASTGHMSMITIAPNETEGITNQNRGGDPLLMLPQIPKTLGRQDYVPSTAQNSMPTAKEPQAWDRYRCKSENDGEIEFVEARKAYYSQSHHDRHLLSGEEDHSQNPTRTKVQFLGIGLGNGHGSGASKTQDELVSESPTGVDFNNYQSAWR